MPQIPTIGRAVHYRAHGSPNGQHKPADRAATITIVHNETDVGLFVMNPNGIFLNEHCLYDDSETPAGGTWHWPPRV